MKSERDGEELDQFAVTAPGLEQICAAELAALGLAGSVIDGGVAWRGGPDSLYRANLELRTASRVLARLGSFRARTFPELERHAARLPWRRFIAPGGAVALRVTSRKSRLYHTDAIAERIGRGLADQLGVTIDVRRGIDDDADASAAAADAVDAADRPAASAPLRAGQLTGAQLVVVRFVRDECTISVDASGALLHQRGYRQSVAKAPLRETIAAALLLAGGWRGGTPLVDPFCGSGTIAIEGALLARRIAPGLAMASREPRRYAFQTWPGYDATAFQSIVEQSRARIRSAADVPVMAADRNAGAITAAASNAARAGVQADIELLRQPLSQLSPPRHPGHVVTNPPYGVRIGDRDELVPLYAALGRMAAEQLRGWRIVLLAAEPELAAATRLRLRELFATRNGGIAVRALTGMHGPQRADGV